MFNFNQSKKFLAIVGCALAGFLSFSSAQAQTVTVTAEVAFVAPITIGTNNNLQFGALNVAMLLGDTVTIAPGGGVSESAANIVSPVAALAPADLTVTATPLLPINVLVDNAANGGGAYSLAGFQCEYNGGGAAACDAGAGGLDILSSVASAPLFVGATLTGAGGAVAGVFNGSVDVTVTYQ